LKAKWLFLIPIAIALPIVFQNCAQPLPDTSDSSSSTSADPGGNYVATKPCDFTLTSGSSWKVPSDWNSGDNTIEAIGNGSDAGGNVRGGGGGGAYSKSVNVALTPGSTVAYSVAHVAVSLQAGTDSGDSWFCNSASNCSSLTASAVVVSAQGGKGSTNGANLDSIGGVGGSAAAGIAIGPGALKYSGGSGGNCANSTCSTGTAPGSGGGAAGPHGNGGNGGNGAGGVPDAGVTGGSSGAGGAAPAGNGTGYGGGAAGGPDMQPGGTGSGGIIIIHYTGKTCS
jgi:hypothetical protein